MITSLLADLLPWAIGIVLTFLGVWGYGRRKKKEGREETYIETLKDSAKRQEAGREAVSDLRGAGRDELIDRVRRNDGQW